MDFTPQQKAWIKLICLVIGTGGGITISTFLGGAKLWIAVLAGLAAGGMNVYHAMSTSPGESSQPPKSAPSGS